jgi:GntR family transcriptional repressor for pyruvate dehydrogenase complex
MTEIRNKDMPRTVAAKTRITRVTGRRRIADEIVEALRSQIASGALPHGARLPAERDLANRYGVSGPTVREALQGLNAMGLLDVRHGSGTYVSAIGDVLLARALATVVELQNVSVPNLIGLLGALTAYAARLATTRSTEDDIVALEGAIAAIATANDIDMIIRSLKDFVAGIAAAAHDPLLLAIARFLLDVQLELALTQRHSFKHWQSLVALLQPDRIAIVEALKRRDPDESSARVTAFHARAVSLISAANRTADATSDGRLIGILAQLATADRPTS